MPIVKTVTLPKLNIKVDFLDREAMRVGHPEVKFRLSGAFPQSALPIDWTRNDTLVFPLLGNGWEQFGDCMYAAACHGDQTFTGNVGVQQVFDIATVLKDYTTASGGDNGLNVGQIIDCWKHGLGGVQNANILAASDIDPTDATVMQAAISLFGGVFFMLNVPDTWLALEDGGFWDAPANADSNNGHGVWINGVDANGNYKVQTWGIHGWLTPAGVKVCDPSAFVVFTNRWFGVGGIAPNGSSFNTLAALWKQFGGALPYPFYQSRSLETATTFECEQDGVWLMADFDGDGIPDLVFVKTANTPSGRVELHIASGASNYQTRILETVTAFPCEQDGNWLLMDCDHTGALDLVFIKTGPTPSGCVEVHIASGTSTYQNFIFQAPTTFTLETDGVWTMLKASGSDRPDLALIKTANTPSDTAEVHIASGQSGYVTRTLEVASIIPNSNAGTWTFCGYSDGNERDLCFIQTNSTGTGDVELHIASASSRYSKWAIETPTTFGLEADGTWCMTSQRGVEKPLSRYQARKHP